MFSRSIQGAGGQPKPLSAQLSEFQTQENPSRALILQKWENVLLTFLKKINVDLNIKLFPLSKTYVLISSCTALNSS